MSNMTIILIKHSLLFCMLLFVSELLQLSQVYMRASWQNSWRILANADVLEESQIRRTAADSAAAVSLHWANPRWEMSSKFLPVSSRLSPSSKSVAKLREFLCVRPLFLNASHAMQAIWPYCMEIHDVNKNAQKYLPFWYQQKKRIYIETRAEISKRTLTLKREKETRSFAANFSSRSVIHFIKA